MSIYKKWQKAWKDNRVFESNPDKKKKYFLNFPYPYINAYQHIGHLFTLMRVEALARYKRLTGHNVLFAQGWHATGSPIIQAAKRVKNKEPKQLKIMADMGFTDPEQLKKFEEPKYWIDFFAPEFQKDFEELGMSVDWRRNFYTTSLNPHYDAFIRWQFTRLKEMGYVIKGKFPVVWDPVEHLPVGDHDRIKGEGETPQEFCLFKFTLADGRKIITATLRPDTVMGITNVYVHPDENYQEITFDDEVWIVGKAIIPKLEEQDFVFTQGKDVEGKKLVGQMVKTCVDTQIPVLPATFLDPAYGTGMVHSVPSDSADDLIALQNLQDDDELIEQYNLDKNMIKALQPIAVFDTPEIGSFPAKYFLEKHGVKDQNDRKKLEQIKKELYKLTFNQSTFNEKYKTGFSQNLQGTLVKEGQVIIKRDLLEKKHIALFYELTGPVVARSLAECVVKVVSDQWFMDYENPQWKQKAHECLDQLTLYPEKARPQFDYVIDWLHEWACTREEGLGTRLPWDEKWLIESLSDSTLYMAYYTIAHKIKDLDPQKLDVAFFDYVFLKKDVAIQVDKKIADELRNEFDYWYPVDFRNSGKDLIQNHLTFYLFNHVAFFDKDKWPKGIGINGWVTVDGQKMSKSLGNMVPVRTAVKKYGPDACRFTILSGGEGMDDPNWDNRLADSMPGKLEQFIQFCKENYNKPKVEMSPIDNWLESRIHTLVQETTKLMEETHFRSAIQKVYFEFNRILKWYMRRAKNVNGAVLDRAIESQIILLSPFCPHYCEEAWSAIGKKGFVTQADWPKVDESLVQSKDSEVLVRNISDDIAAVIQLAKMNKPKTIMLITADAWKYELYDVLRQQLQKTRNPKEIIQAVMSSNLKQYGKQIMKIIPRVIKAGSVPEFFDQDFEQQILHDATEFFTEQFGAEVVVIAEAKAEDGKKTQAMPGKPAIIVA